ncbi:ABC transporter permease [Frigidibacter sp. MR17.14]|uniref:ABC transporter permease n=1 Tax=Frigidibacter sp. MR17.14 TaxID=3126509 RepID=UPI003012A8DC
MASVAYHSIHHLWDVVQVLVARDQRSRYRSTLFGMLWAVASPALFLMTFYFLFAVALPLNVPNYVPHLFIGLIAWTWFQTSILDSVRAILGNASLIAQPGFPSPALPMSIVVSNLLTLLLSLPLLVVILIVNDTAPGWSLLALPVVLAIQFALTLAGSYVAAALNVSFRDLQYIAPLILQVGYFMTPIFYDLAAISERARAVLAFNPMVQVIEAYRAILIQGDWPGVAGLGLTALGSGLALWLAVRFFRHASFDFLEEL